MGEQGSRSASNNIIFVIMRNSRGKLIVYVALISVLFFIVFLLSRTHKSLKELEGVNEKCQQQRDSLSAQLQVVYEHKNRLEKSLQQEKTDHRHSTEVNEKQLHELEIKLQQEKEKTQQLEAQITQLKTSFSELEEDKTQAENVMKEQLKSLQTQKNAEIEKLHTQISDLLAEKDKLDMANNAFSWKIEQHASEVNLCHLQLQQIKNEYGTCQEQLQKHIQNRIDEPSSKSNFKTTLAKVSKTAETENKLLSTANKEENVGVIANQTHVAPVRDKLNVLERPHVMAMNNAVDGVLPKPLDMKQDDSNKVLDAAMEVQDHQKEGEFHKKQASNNIDLGKQVPTKDDGKKEIGSKLLAMQNKLRAAENAQIRDQENHPQVQPPNNFDNVADHEDHAGERGEFGNEIPQYPAANDARNQVEQPVFQDFHNRHPDKNKHFLPMPRQINNDLAAAQVQDMMNKSPGNVNNDRDHVLKAPREFGAALDNKINQFRNGPFLHGRADGHRANDEKLYEEDDDDRENDDEPANGAGQGIRGNLFQDNDFEDQENQDNMDNAKEEEGVVVAPK